MKKKFVIIAVSFCFLITIVVSLEMGKRLYRKIQSIERYAKNSNRIVYLSNYTSRHLTPIVSPFNHRIVNLNDIEHGYSFLLGGHLGSTGPERPDNVLEKDFAKSLESSCPLHVGGRIVCFTQKQESTNEYSLLLQYRVLDYDFQAARYYQHKHTPLC